MQEKLSEQEKANTQLQAERREREAELKQEVGPNLHHFSLGSRTEEAWHLVTAEILQDSTAQHLFVIFVFPTGAAARAEAT